MPATTSKTKPAKPWAARVHIRERIKNARINPDHYQVFHNPGMAPQAAPRPQLSG